ncbi:hypothetical protein JZ751_021496 [Albula glossodonta]|uniref:Uncharacterized protein n=1 Tax=Albula glossodonta TaxID=121402 RepID=A0A8T2NI93_9TELE|nr:hypothetical protein JZ751_021496 [Albula glossodonta]
MAACSLTLSRSAEDCHPCAEGAEVGVGRTKRQAFVQPANERHRCLHHQSKLSPSPIMVILLNCVTLGMYQPCENIDCSSDRCQILQRSAICRMSNVAATDGRLGAGRVPGERRASHSGRAAADTLTPTRSSQITSALSPGSLQNGEQSQKLEHLASLLGYAFDAFIYIFFALEMVVKMVALGIFGRLCVDSSPWLVLDRVSRLLGPRMNSLFQWSKTGL